VEIIYIQTTNTMDSNKNIFKDKVLLITGGTGSFGNKVLKKFLDSDIKEIRIFSRDEKKQDDMRRKYSNDKIKFYIGDVRDINSIDNAMVGVDYVFQAAALKQVPSCEFFPVEAVKTNVLGTENVLNSAIKNKVKKVICLSTDKAAYPINAMGMSKALMEKVAMAEARTVRGKETTICITRYGNVMGSRGSVIPLFYKLISEGKPLTVTNPEMTRFMMTLEDAVDLVLFAFKNGAPGDLFVQKSPAATIGTLAKAICKHKKVKEDVKIIGTRHGEKEYETLVTKEEMIHAVDMGNYFKIAADKRDLNYEKYFSEGQKKIENITEYNSHNTERLDVDGVIKLLIKMGEIEE
jgi:UDP-glucose 4-epimerase